MIANLLAGKLILQMPRRKCPRGNDSTGSQEIIDNVTPPTLSIQHFGKPRNSIIYVYVYQSTSKTDASGSLWMLQSLCFFWWGVGCVQHDSIVYPACLGLIGSILMTALSLPWVLGMLWCGLHSDSLILGENVLKLNKIAFCPAALQRLDIFSTEQRSLYLFWQSWQGEQCLIIPALY